MEPDDPFLPSLYERLRQLASAQKAAGCPIQPNGLIDKVWSELRAHTQPDAKRRARFFLAAAEAMRRILIDDARRRLAQRRDERVRPISADVIFRTGEPDDFRLLEVNRALEKLAVNEPDKAQLVNLRFFVGLTLEEAAQVLALDEPTARRWWAYARAWLLNDLKAGALPDLPAEPANAQADDPNDQVGSKPKVHGHVARVRQSMTIDLQEIVRRSTHPLLAPARFVYNFCHKLRCALISRFGTTRRRRGPDDGFQGAGLPARLRPPPPVLFAGAAKSLPPPDEDSA